MPLAPAEPITYPTYSTMQFDGTVSGAADLLYAIDTGLGAKLLLWAEIRGSQEGDNPQQWRITMQPGVNGIPYGESLIADAGAWVVVASGGVNRIRVLSDADYHAEFQT